MSLIQLNDITAVKDISSNIGKVAQQHIDDAELVDLKPLLGEKLYYDLVKNSTSAPYPDLLNEKEYTYDSFLYRSPGLKRVLIEFTYARLMFFGNEKSTPFGLVEKKYQDGTPVTRDRAKERYKASQQIAMQLWYDVRAYLDRNTSTYEHWNCGDDMGMLTGFKLKHIR